MRRRRDASIARVCEAGEAFISKKPTFSHFDRLGRARMVDVSRKRPTRRVAVASCLVALSQETVSRLSELPKGDALAVARIAGIQAAKRTGEWIPLAHPLPLEEVAVEFDVVSGGLRIQARAVTVGRTGVEMEALVACAAAALALYDMVKSVERGAVIRDLKLESKSGGRSGVWTRPGA